MSTLASVSSVVRGWSPVERKQALVEIVRDMVPPDGQPFVIEDIGMFLPRNGNAVTMELDDSTEYLREMRRRLETPEDSRSPHGV